MILQTTNLSKFFESDNNVIKAVNNVNLSVEQKEFISIVGTSGSGKTTFLNALAGLEKPTAGEVLINGVNIYDFKSDDLIKYRRKNLGFVFQNFNLLPMLNVKENIILPISLDNKKVDEVYLNDIIKLLGIEDKINEFPSKLSGGQQQRVAIARAIIAKPTILFADEPTGNLDKKTREDVIHLLKSVSKELNQTILMVTHDIEIAKETDRIITLEDGKIIGERSL